MVRIQMEALLQLTLISCAIREYFLWTKDTALFGICAASSMEAWIHSMFVIYIVSWRRCPGPTTAHMSNVAFPTFAEWQYRDYEAFHQNSLGMNETQKKR